MCNSHILHILALKYSRFGFFLSQSYFVYFKALRKTRFSELFVFASFGNVCFSKFSFSRVSEIAVFRDFCVFSQFFCEKIAKIAFFPKNRVGTSFLSFYRTRLDFRKLVPTRKPTRKLG